MADINKVLHSLFLALIIVLVVVLICNYKKMHYPEGLVNRRIQRGFLPYITQRLTGNTIYDNNRIAHNRLNPRSINLISPNMREFEEKIRNIQNKEIRQPNYIPNEEAFHAGMREYYRPGDWNVNGITANNMMKKVEGF